MKLDELIAQIVGFDPSFTKWLANAIATPEAIAKECDTRGTIARRERNTVAARKWEVWSVVAEHIAAAKNLAIDCASAAFAVVDRQDALDNVGAQFEGACCEDPCIKPYKDEFTATFIAEIERLALAEEQEQQ